MGELERSAGRMEVLSEQQCLEFLQSKDLGRIAFFAGNDTEIFPVSYASDAAVVVFRTAPGTKLDKATSGRVTFEVDDWDPDAKVGWSVVLKGAALEVTRGMDPFASTLRTRPVSPLAPGERDHWIAVYPSEITGRRFRRL
jgi:uncharacterized protein